MDLDNKGPWDVWRFTWFLWRHSFLHNRTVHPILLRLPASYHCRPFFIVVLSSWQDHSPKILLCLPIIVCRPSSFHSWQNGAPSTYTVVVSTSHRCRPAILDRTIPSMPSSSTSQPANYRWLTSFPTKSFTMAFFSSTSSYVYKVRSDPTCFFFHRSQPSVSSFLSGQHHSTRHHGSSWHPWQNFRSTTPCSSNTASIIFDFRQNLIRQILLLPHQPALSSTVSFTE